MPTGLTSTIVVNETLQMIGSQTQITALTDGSRAAKAASTVYSATVTLLLRELDPDFARFTAALTLSAAPTPVQPWAFEYLYPSDCLRLRQVAPLAGSYDPNDPQPIRANVAFDVIGSVSTKVILTNQASAVGIYTSSTPTEEQWDAVFQDAVVRRLGNPLAMALAGRPDFAEKLLMQSAQMASTAESVDDSGFRRAM